MRTTVRWRLSSAWASACTRRAPRCSRAERCACDRDYDHGDKASANESAQDTSRAATRVLERRRAAEEGRARRKKQRAARRFGKTSAGKLVCTARLERLEAMGYETEVAAEALRSHENDEARRDLGAISDLGTISARSRRDTGAISAGARDRRADYAGRGRVDLSRNLRATRRRVKGRCDARHTPTHT